MTTDDARIRGKVAAILTRRELFLNVGEEDGVELGMKFAILTSEGVDIPDPDSGEILGTVNLPKTVVKVVRFNGPNLSVGRTFRTIQGSPGIASAVLDISSITGTPSRTETLAIESGSSLRAELSEQESYVKPGDPAVLIEDDEYDDA